MTDIGGELRKDVPRDYITTRGKGRNQLDYVSGRSAFVYCHRDTLF